MRSNEKIFDFFKIKRNFFNSSPQNYVDPVFFLNAQVENHTQ